MLLVSLAIAVGCGPITQAKPALELNLPIGCKLGQDCFILLYADREPGPEAVDFGCGRMTYDGHKGTDFAIASEQVMAQGVSVKAAAAGTVLRVRDGIADQRIKDANQRAQVEGTECGNGVVVNHGDGWETQYCHLRQGSVAVKPGDEVTANSILGLVGTSGLASFPHVHLTVRHQGQVVDPFVGPTTKSGCQVQREPLWHQPLAYVPTGLIRAGFAPQPPQLDQLWAGDFAETILPTTSPALVFWVQTYGVLTGDVEQIQLIAPDGEIVAEQQQPLSTSQKIWMSYVGKRGTNTSWTPGRWQGRYKLVRNNQVLVERQQTILLE
ncbi:MAG: M23 family metallopeptidase [Cyanothece sp. SIO1E1]|nr:M23 family metallopeptidase [Cyanothece sp. SIO1E1]